MTINTAWHADHPLPKRASMAERVQWHVAHARACGCRPIPRSVQAYLQGGSDQRDAGSETTLPPITRHAPPKRFHTRK